MSDLIREGVKVKIAEVIRRCVMIAKSPKASGRQRLLAIAFLRKTQWAGLSEIATPDAMERIRETRRGA